MGKFGKTYCTIPLHLLRSLVESYEHDKNSIPEILEGLRHLIPAINDYFKFLPSMFEQNMKKTDANLILYESFALSNNEQEEFETSDGYCFAKFYKYGCPYLQLTNVYNLIPIESINNLVHIVPQFD
ncbi:6999_t:CDS:2, partial [Cetraspora pellucida]